MLRLYYLIVISIGIISNNNVINANNKYDDGDDDDDESGNSNNNNNKDESIICKSLLDTNCIIDLDIASNDNDNVNTNNNNNVDDDNTIKMNANDNNNDILHEIPRGGSSGKGNPFSNIGGSKSNKKQEILMKSLDNYFAKPNLSGPKRSKKRTLLSSSLKDTSTAKQKKAQSKSSSSSSSQHDKQQQQQQLRTVTISIPNYGKIKGIREEGIDIFKKIPFASPPVGHLRFSPPEPVQPWHPTKLDAYSSYGPECWQIAHPVANPLASENNMSEDCLYLNVFTPAGHADRARQGKFFPGSKLLPVMVWFHGGAFQQGSSSRPEYDGRRLAERDIIVVTFNYRLGALGFLVSSADGLFGNFGVMDQRAALEFISKNIQAFGGDPNNITLFGESAGAVCIGLHLMMDNMDTNNSNSNHVQNNNKGQQHHQHGSNQYTNQHNQLPRNNKRYFHRVIMQSNPLGYTFRSIVVADFIGEALKRAVDCRDLTCLRAERVEEIIRAQNSFIGVPRSVGDFFTWSPTLTKEMKLKVSVFSAQEKLVMRRFEHRLPRLDASTTTTTSNNQHQKSQYHRQNFISEWRYGMTDEESSSSMRWGAVNVSQPLEHIHYIPDDIPIIVGSNKHEGEIFVHSAFPAPMPKAVYWMFVGALFRDSASKILKHYRGYVDEVEADANDLAKKQIDEEEAKHDYLENKDYLDKEYDILVNMNATKRMRVSTNGNQDFMQGNDRLHSLLLHPWDTTTSTTTTTIINTTTTTDNDQNSNTMLKSIQNTINNKIQTIKETNQKLQQFNTTVEKTNYLRQLKYEKRIMKQKQKALKEASKVIVDYRPVMSRIINDYLFRCPTWRYAQLVSERRKMKKKMSNSSTGNNHNRRDNTDDPKSNDDNNNNNNYYNRHHNVVGDVYVYRFSQPTHIPGFKECWGKACHTAELPYVFQAMDVLRSNYSTLGPFGQNEAPSAPEAPFTDIMAAYRSAFQEAYYDISTTKQEEQKLNDDNDNDSYRFNKRSSTYSSQGYMNRKSTSTSSSKTTNDHAKSDQMNHTKNSHQTSHHPAFQAILQHFFGDYFTIDADFELASDMADRWTSFARDGNPNYDGSLVTWMPWLHNFSQFINADDSTATVTSSTTTNFDYNNMMNDMLDDNNFDSTDFVVPSSSRSTNNFHSSSSFMNMNHEDESFLSDTDVDDQHYHTRRTTTTNNPFFNAFYHPNDDNNDHDLLYDDTSDEEEVELNTIYNKQSINHKKEYYRQNILKSLKLEVIEEDSLHTELRSFTSSTNDDNSNNAKSHYSESFYHKLFGVTSTSSKQEDHQQQQDASTMNQQGNNVYDLLSIAQEMGIIGSFGNHDQQQQQSNLLFFPEILELSWPPDGRLIEKDCTCDLWDKIRYRY